MKTMKKDFKYLDRRLSPMELGLILAMIVSALAGAGVLWLLLEVIG